MKICVIKIKRNLMMEYNAEEVYQRRKRQWLTYGRALLTIGILGLLTVTLYYVSQNISYSLSNAKEETELSQIVEIEQNQIKFDPDASINTNDIPIIDHNINVDDNKNKKIINKVKRSSDLLSLVNNSEQQKKVAVDENEIPKDYSENLLVHESSERHYRQQQSNNDIVHRHSNDGGIYIFKGYKCIPISKPSKQLENLRARHRVGMCAR
jgi:hypothetical protein